MGRRACRFLLLLDLVSAVVRGSESHVTHDHIFTVSDSRLPGFPICIPQTSGSLFVASNDRDTLNQSFRGVKYEDYRRSRRKRGGGGYFTTDGQSVCLGIEHPCGTL
jgi:hypothetical protein